MHRRHLVRGIDRDHGKILHRALRFHRKCPDRIDLISEELNADRVLLGQREDVHDAAADRELAGAFHSGLALIAEGDQRLFDLFLVIGFPGEQDQQAAVDIVRRSDHVHEGIDRGDDGAGFFLQDVRDDRHTLPCQQASLNIRLIEQNILRGIKIRIGNKAGKIIQDLPCSGLAVGDKQAQRKFLRKRLCKMCFLGVHAAADGDRAAAGGKGLRGILKLTDFRKEFVHRYRSCIY